MTDSMPASIARHLGFLTVTPSKLTRRERIAQANAYLDDAEKEIEAGSLRAAERAINAADKLWPRDLGQRRLDEVARKLIASEKGA